MRIARDGTWFYRGSPIGRQPLVKLFGSVLHREPDGSYWLVTPAERGRIEVEDVPFLAVALTAEGEGRAQRLIFRTNLDEFVTAGPDNLLRWRPLRAAGRYPIFWCATVSRRGSRGLCSTISLISAPRNGSRTRRHSGFGAKGCSFGWASLGRIGNDLPVPSVGIGIEPLRPHEKLTSDQVIERFLQLGKPGRRGFGGASDAAEAAALREATRGDHDLNPGMTPPSAALRPAAVLVPLIDRPAGMSVLLTQRTPHLSAHAGQISFPGGRIEERDTDATEAALRETEEEIGLTREHVRVIGRLDTYVTGTGFEITPIVGIVKAPFPLAIDPFEVSEAFEVPLSFIVDPCNHRRMTREVERRARVFFVLPFENRNIWGATAGMLVNLAEVLAG